MATWVDVTAPANWSAVQTSRADGAPPPYCGAASASTIGSDVIGTHPDDLASSYLGRFTREVTGPKYEWNGSRWVPNDRMDSPGFTSSNIPLLEYIGSLTGIQKIRITAELHSTRTFSSYYQVGTPFGSWPAGTVCASEPYLSIDSHLFSESGSIPANTEFIYESSYASVFATACFASWTTETNDFLVGEVMDITKIEMYADAVGDFWTDFMDLTET